MQAQLLHLGPDHLDQQLRRGRQPLGGGGGDAHSALQFALAKVQRHHLPGLQLAPQPGDRPLVIIRFDRPNVNYQQALYNAVSQALSRKPTATFDLMAISPSQGTAAQVALNSAAAKRNAEDVLRTLTDMGVPGSRVQSASVQWKIIRGILSSVAVRFPP